MRARLAILLALSAFLTGCTQLFLYPQTVHVATPADVGFDYEDVFLQSADGTRLHGWYLPARGERHGLVYFLHGNAENISTHHRAVLWLVQAGYDVFALDYRGYGLSEGKADVPEVLDDIEAGTRYLLTRRGEDTVPLYLFGQSLGASLSIAYLGRLPDSRVQFNALLAEAAFSSFGSMARTVASHIWLTWPFQYPVGWIISDDYDPIDYIASLAPLPILLVHSVDDTIVPYRNAERLAERLGDTGELVDASGFHIRAMADPALRNRVLGFFAENSLLAAAHTPSDASGSARDF